MKKALSLVFSFILVFTLFIPCAFAAEKSINNVNITIPEPKVGEEIGYSATVENDDCFIQAVIWHCEKNRRKSIVASDVFLPGYNYSVVVTVNTRDNSDVFSENCVITVNGESVKNQSQTNSFLIFEYDFGEIESADSKFSVPVIIGQVKEIFKRIYQFVAALFGVYVF